MKNTIKFMIGLLAIGLVSCEPEFENAVTDEGFYDAGDADFSNYVALGNSLTAGYANGTMYTSGQKDSYPNIMAEQFGFVGGGDFTQPLMSDDIGGLLLNGEPLPGYGTRLVLSADENGNPFPTSIAGTPTTDIATSATGPFNNMGVPGAKSFNLKAEGFGDIAGIANGTANPWYARFATSTSSRVIDDAVSLDPTFFSLWIGTNDIQSYASSGGSGIDQTGNTDTSDYGYFDLTDPGVFAESLSSYVADLTANGAKGVLLNLPDVRSSPGYTTIPARSIPLDAATAGAVNAQFALYNGALGQLVAGGFISADEAALRQVNFIEGVNYPIMTDVDLTDVTAILIGGGVDPQTAALLGQLRQATDDDLIILSAQSVLGVTPDPSNPLGVIGVTIPVTNQYVLTTTEQALVSSFTNTYNTIIQGLAADYGLGYVDINAAFNEVASVGIPFNGGVLTSAYVTGGAFSLDASHGTPRGYAFIANQVIDVINTTYNASIPKVDIGTYGTVTLHNN
jgi:hypothetical protein